MAKPKKSPAKKPVAKKPATDWVAVLRSGAAGVRKWNKLTSSERKATRFAKGDYAGADLTDANFRGLTATKFRAPGAALVGANFVGASFLAADFSGADLTGAHLRGFNGRDADFSAAKLVGADLWEGRFLRAKFAKADLTRANFLNADLTAADFTDAILTDVNLTGAAFDNSTKWPVGFVVPGEARWTGKGTDPRLVGKGKNAAARDINGLMARLHATIDEKRMGRVLDMLRKERNQIFSEVEPTLVRGIVRSQRDIDTVYSCVLTDDGTYSCCTPDMAQCMGLSDEPCKHLLVLVIGLARAGQLDPTTADAWVVAAGKKNPRWNKTVQNHMADSLLKYKGAVAGEIDWRPTETIPEDFYAM
jgi:uncharacterized protein YjbI with pentapeptide repeats